MSQPANSEALNLLLDFQKSTFRNAAQIPQKEAVEDEWQGVGFVVGGIRVVSPLGEVTETLQLPDLTRIPAVKNWVLGVANIRGTLVPVIDLQLYLGLAATVPLSEWRVLLVRKGAGLCGLLVEQSLGMMHFPADSYSPEKAPDMNELEPYLNGAFRQGGRIYHEIELKSVIEDERFDDVGQVQTELH